MSEIRKEDDFISKLTGRAKYLREKGEIKSPELLERAADALRERAEPAYYLNQIDYGDGEGFELRAYFRELDAMKSKDDFGGVVIPAYTAPPVPVVADAAAAIRACMDEFPESVHDIVEECADIAENAFRDAMLQPVSTPYKSPRKEG
ncbi:hypothetical protein [Cronobacter sakazakii]|uniref:hypothetical protein n=1 Tax=Cronobacter sakazakii TaxID=28141 RepID=UPI0013762DB9|nr:hypothetical protein [Cronobacter sakazakii]NCH77932.1 hypothetical protein [Cronobacter sakazakii]